MTPEDHRRGLDKKILEERISKVRKANESDLFPYLTPREREVLTDLYLTGTEVPTYAVEARKLDLKRERIGQLVKRGLTIIDILLESSPDSLPRTGRRGIRRSLEIDRLLGPNPQQTLHELYWGQGLSTTDIGKRFKCREGSVTNRMRKLNIPRRPRGVPRKNITGILEL